MLNSLFIDNWNNWNNDTTSATPTPPPIHIRRGPKFCHHYVYWCPSTFLKNIFWYVCELFVPILIIEQLSDSLSSFILLCWQPVEIKTVEASWGQLLLIEYLAAATRVTFLIKVIHMSYYDFVNVLIIKDIIYMNMWLKCDFATMYIDGDDDKFCYSYWWLSIKLQYLWYISNEVTAALH